mgnify:CR=1 FL=1|jgi:hypothetical protein
MVISPHPQGSVEWLKARLGVVTASELDNLVTPEFKLRTGETPKSYLAKKVAEKLTGDYMDGLSTFDIEQGTILEEEARPWLAMELDCDIENVGLITRDDGRCGCSPDGIICNKSANDILDLGIGVEIKCPKASTHAKYLLNGELPKEYAAQVHGSMYVTGLSKWYFVSYHRKMPKLVLLVERDEAIQERIHEAVTKFIAEMDAALEKIEKIK